LGLGIALGAGVAILCAPQSGRDLRRQLSERFDGAADDLEETAEHMLANSPQ
jgi:gas vesicle protein